ncbi:S-layer homology domain-containing protein [Effusibacillus lacus]|uniref:SLH domain-containing protein n=1 Tax=Effusibacillus lacus TaxID=1348429 RepID=A0A292YNJ0_9BACL|nr:S-layer homology domain-containing protein [Effusibacillus lacus]TCS76508.1 S-layer family protein [Effusibacillus lacus]GAX90469.1 hypothetical protein EFBL_2096 [Effusibacillus lacus]
MTQKWKALVSSLLVFLLLFASASFNTAAANEANNFRDLGASHNWALKDVAKMSLRQIIQGDGNGNFLPDQYVSQEQAVAMVIRALGLKGEVDQYDPAAYQLQYRNVSNWAKPYVAIADRYRLLRWEEESRFDGISAASREWVAQLLVRMIDKEDDVSQYSQTASSFADTDKIHAWALDYVKLASSDAYGLIKGIPNANGTVNFNPLDFVTRIQLAALISRAEPFLTVHRDTELQGDIVSVTGNQMVVQTSAGLQTVTLTSGTLVFKNDRQANAASLEPMQPVLVIGKPTAAYIEVLDESRRVEKVSGTLVKVYKDLKAIALSDSSNNLKTYELSEQATYRSIDGTLTSFDGLSENDTVELTILRGKVISVYRLAGGTSTTNAGIIYEWDQANGLLTLQKLSGTPQIYRIGSAVTVTYPDNRTTGLNDLFKGMEVELTVLDNVVSKIHVKTIVEEGTVISLSSDKSILTYEKNDGTPSVRKIAADATIKYGSGATALLSDLQEGDKIVIHIADNGIKSLTISNRTGQSVGELSDLYIEGTVVSLDENAKTLVLKDNSGELKSYEYDTLPELYVNGESDPTLADIKKDMKAKIQLFDDKIVYIEVDNRIEGTVVLIDPDRRIMTLALDGNTQKNYFVDSDYDVNIKDESSADLSDLERNDYVRVELTETNKIKEIDVKRELEYKVTDVSTSSKRLRVEDDDGNSESLYIYSDVRLTVPGINNPKVDDVKEDDLVKATYFGNELKAVEVLPVTRGFITSINTARNEVAVKKFDGSTTTITFGSEDTVKVNSQSYSQINSLAAGDRIEVRFSLGNKKIFDVMQKLEGTFSYVSDSDYLYLIESATRYKLAENPYIHKADTGLTLRNLSKYDKIAIYLLDDVVYEIEKTN